MALVGYWKLNDNAATATVVDYSVTGNDGAAIANTNTLHAFGQPGHSLTFDGAADEITVAAPVGLDFGATDDFSISMRIMGTMGSASSAVVNKTQAGLTGYRVAYDPVGCRVFFVTWDQGNTLSRAIEDPVPEANDGRWHLITAVRYANAKDSLEIWFDGQFRNADDVAPGANRDLTNNGDLLIGAAGNTEGRMAEVMIFDHALSGGEIQGMFGQYNQSYMRRGFRGA